MSTVVQTSYRPSLAKGVPGLILDEGGYEIATRKCASAGGVGFGFAVSEVADGKAILGGGAFLGIAARDVTLNGVSLLPMSDTADETDKYSLYRNMAIMTRGRIYVTVDTAVAAGDAVYYDYVTGQLGNSSSGRAATGSVTFKGQPAASDTITFNGTAITFKASGATGDDVNIQGSLADTITALVTKLNASSDGNINDATYEAFPPGVGAAYEVHISHDTPGVGGNSYTLAKSCANATLSGSTLSGGYAGDHATGQIVFTTNPADGKKITLNGFDVAFKNTPGANDIQIGGDLATTLASLKTDLNNASAAPGNNAEVAKCTYDVVDGTTLTISFDTIGLTGNPYTISTDVAGATASGPTLSGGAPPSVSLSNTYWATSGLAGDLAVVSLGIQR